MKKENKKYIVQILQNIGIFLIKFGILIAMVRLASKIGVI